MLFLLALALHFQVSEADPTQVVVVAPFEEGAKLTLHRLEADRKIGPAMFAKLETAGDEIRLTPSVPLSRGATYLAQFSSKAGSHRVAEFTVPKFKGDPPQIVQIRPTANQLPANLLKFYLEFDQPMREGRAIFDQIHLEDKNGNRVHSPWRRQELWNADSTRLTLWIHPGRIKRGVNLREELGPVLKPEAKYRLLIEKSLQNAAGTPLDADFRHEFTTSAEDHVRPLPQNWKLEIPVLGSQNPLAVQSPKPLDHALIERYVWIENDIGEKLEIEFKIGLSQESWTMTPTASWKSGVHRLHVGLRLEDLAGNTPERVFDTDLEVASPDPPPRYLEFRPRNADRD